MDAFLSNLLALVKPEYDNVQVPTYSRRPRRESIVAATHLPQELGKVNGVLEGHGSNRSWHAVLIPGGRYSKELRGIRVSLARESLGESQVKASNESSDA
jgi:hypothetical protein